MFSWLIIPWPDKRTHINKQIWSGGSQGYETFRAGYYTNCLHTFRICSRKLPNPLVRGEYHTKSKHMLEIHLLFSFVCFKSMHKVNVCVSNVCNAVCNAQAFSYTSRNFQPWPHKNLATVYCWIELVLFYYCFAVVLCCFYCPDPRG